MHAACTIVRVLSTRNTVSAVLPKVGCWGVASPWVACGVCGGGPAATSLQACDITSMLLIHLE